MGKRVFAAAACLMCCQPAIADSDHATLDERYYVVCRPVETPDGEFYFVGGKRTGGGYELASPLSLLKMSASDEGAEPCLPQDTWEKVFPSFQQPPDRCFEVSPDGKFLAIGRHALRANPASTTESLTTTDIVLFDVKKRALRVLVADGLDNRDYYFSPDGKHLLYYARPADAFQKMTAFANPEPRPYWVRLATVDTGEIETLFEAPPTTIWDFTGRVSACWAPDSPSVVFKHWISLPDDSRTDLLLYSLGSGETRTLATNRFGFSTVSFLENGRIVTARDAEKVLLIDAETGETRELASGQGKGISKIRVEGERLVYQLGPDADNTTGTVMIPASVK